MLVADVARTSNQVSETSSRLSKVSLIADLLRQCARQVVDGTAPADEVGLTTRYLSGSLRHRRTGIELSSLAELLSELPKAPDTGVMTLSELDTVLQQAGELAGAGSSRVRANLFLGLVRKLTAQERVLVQGLLRGGPRQGALESVVMTPRQRACKLRSRHSCSTSCTWTDPISSTSPPASGEPSWRMPGPSPT